MFHHEEIKKLEEENEKLTKEVEFWKKTADEFKEKWEISITELETIGKILKQQKSS